MVSTPISGLNSKNLNSGRGHYIVFLGMTLYSHSVKKDAGIFNGWGYLALHQGMGRNTPRNLMFTLLLLYFHKKMSF